MKYIYDNFLILCFRRYQEKSSDWIYTFKVNRLCEYSYGTMKFMSRQCHNYRQANISTDFQPISNPDTEQHLNQTTKNSGG